MDHLNKQQVILIALLVAIVTSMTTSIVTISLSDKSSGGASQTIYKVIQQTLDKVTPVDSPVRQIVDNTTTKTTTDEMSLSDIANQAGKNILRIYVADASVPSGKKFVSVGVAVGNKGYILSSDISTSTLALAQPFSAIYSDGTSIPLFFQKNSDSESFSLFQTKDSADIKKLKPVVLTGFSSLSLGSNIVAFGVKEDKSVVSTGIVNEFDNLPGIQATSTANAIASTDVFLSSDNSGWLMLNTFGKVVGFLVPMTEDKIARFLDSSQVKKVTGFEF